MWEMADLGRAVRHLQDQQSALAHSWLWLQPVDFQSVWALGCILLPLDIPKPAHPGRWGEALSF